MVCGKFDTSGVLGVLGVASGKKGVPIEEDQVAGHGFFANPGVMMDRFDGLVRAVVSSLGESLGEVDGLLEENIGGEDVVVLFPGSLAELVAKAGGFVFPSMVGIVEGIVKMGLSTGDIGVEVVEGSEGLVEVLTALAESTHFPPFLEFSAEVAVDQGLEHIEGGKIGDMIEVDLVLGST